MEREEDTVRQKWRKREFESGKEIYKEKRKNERIEETRIEKLTPPKNDVRIKINEGTETVKWKNEARKRKLHGEH